jgi:large subunit ribosomal protein L6
MSRVGKKPIPIPSGVHVRVDVDAVEIEGPKGTLRQIVPPGIRFEETDGTLVARPIKENDTKVGNFHGLARTLVANAVHGVVEGFKKELDIVGIGYRAEVSGQQVVFSLGYSHKINFDVPAGIDVAVDKQTHITVTGIDRQRVGQVAADIRALRKPDPYKQKGVRYTGEVLKKKVGKTGA